MPSTRQTWHRWILIPLWLIHTYFLIPPLLQQLWGHISHVRFMRGWRSLWFLDDFAMLLCLVLEGSEIVQFRYGRLTPKFFLKSAGFKAAYSTWGLYMDIRLWRLGLRMNRFVVMAVLQAISFYMGLGYAIYIRIQSRRRGFDSGGMPEDGGRHNALCPPLALNSATKIKADSPFAVKLILWTKKDPKWLHMLPSPAKTILTLLLWGLRYAVCCVLIHLILPFAGQFPGELKAPFNRGTHSSTSAWDYPKPSLALYEEYTDDDSRPHLSLSSGGDEESAVDTLSLRTLDEDAIRRSSPRPGQRRIAQPSPNRLLGPRYLCFLDDQQTKEYTTQRVEAWLSRSRTQNEPDYVFISYTRQQFYTQIYNDPTITPEDLIHRKAAADRDQTILIGFAVQAAKDAGVPAFWIDFECVQPEDEANNQGDMEDVYRICDIVRASHSLIIVSGPKLHNRMERTSINTTTPHEWLLDWGKRLWTLPEALLCPSEHRISIYAVGREEPEKIAKRNLPSRLWDDAGTIRQLIDHYEASLQLTQLELISIALECLQRRQTEQRNAGDVAYALMGLLRLRPKVHKSDTAFQAFARLSLANDSNMILERLVSLHSPRASADWHDMQDTWDAKLWYIDPGFQISDVGPHNTVVIRDAPGTSIDWTSLQMVDFVGTITSYTLRWSYPRIVSVYTWGYLFASLMLLAYANAEKVPSLVAMAIITGIGTLLLVMALPSPWILSGLFRGQITSAEARIFGMTGIPNKDEVEQRIFGEAHGRMSWNMDGCINTELDEEDDPRPIYTLVDTASMSLTTIRASKPPTMLFVGGRERGLLRVLLCSYDAARKCFVKETVTRLEGAVSSRLASLDRFHFSVQPTVETDVQDQDLQHLGVNNEDDDFMELPNVPEFISMD